MSRALLSDHVRWQVRDRAWINGMDSVFYPSDVWVRTHIREQLEDPVWRHVWHLVVGSMRENFPPKDREFIRRRLERLYG